MLDDLSDGWQIAISVVFVVIVMAVVWSVVVGIVLVLL